MTSPRVPRNYATLDGLELLFMAELGNPGGGALELEANGGQDMLFCDVLPTDLTGATDEDLTAAGFILGGPVEDDPMFRHATLPPGWSRRAAETDGARNTYVVDKHGCPRMLIRYKATPHDRKAFCVALPVVGAS